MAWSTAAASPGARPPRIRLRSARLHQAIGPHPRPNHIVLQAFVVARLLGLRLLTLDAEVLIDSYGDVPMGPAESIGAAQNSREPSYRAPQAGRSSHGIRHALELLEQSDAVLEASVRQRERRPGDKRGAR
jgi:hypothetical protein